MEADEIFLGPRGRGSKAKRGRSRDCVPVVVAVSRGGQAHSDYAAATGKKQLGPFLDRYVRKSSYLMTDEWPGYKTPGKEYALHRTIVHSEKQYALGLVSTNTAESFFAIFRRAWNGTFHWFSREHAHRYAREFARRWSMKRKSLVERIQEVVRAGVRRRPAYEDLVDILP